MKAKEIAQRLKDENFSNKVIGWMVDQFAEEAKQLKEARNIQTDHALIGIFKDQQRKYKAIAKRTDGRLKPDGFFDMLEIYAGEEVAEYAKKELN